MQHHPVLLLQLLFKKVVPHHCLGSIWSQRDKKHNKHSAPTIRATITQFNALAACVVSTVLKHRQIRPHVRARVIQRWIDIAQVRRGSQTDHRSRSLHALSTGWSDSNGSFLHRSVAYAKTSHLCEPSCLRCSPTLCTG